MAESRRPRIPDPSATIPDFGPRPDLKTLEKRAEVMRMLEQERANRGPAPPPGSGRKTNPLVVLVIAVVVAMLAGSAGFFVMVFAGLAIYVILGL